MPPSKVERLYSKPKRLKQSVKASNKRKTNHHNNENKAPSQDLPPSRLPECGWRFWHEPDRNNIGPQLIVTEPDGKNHYLVDAEARAIRTRLHSAPFEAVEEDGFDFTSDGMVYAIPVSRILPEKDKNNKKQRLHACAAQVAEVVSPRWKDIASRRTRLRGGVMQYQKRRSSSAILPLDRINGRSNTLSSSKMERANMSGVKGAYNEPGEVSFRELFKGWGILRTFAYYCCPESEQHQRRT